MSFLGNVIHQEHDQIGPIYVYEDGLKRYLAFAPNDEQSCWAKSEPLVPQHDYIQCMLMVLIWQEPKKIIGIGLGAGVIISSLHAAYPSCKQTVIELRQHVIDIAYRFFQLPRAKRLNVINANIESYFQTEKVIKADILFSDIYLAEGVDDIQLTEDYLEQCFYRLKKDGWLVINCWKEHKNTDVLIRLQKYFSTIRSCSIASGNWVIFASNTQQNSSKKEEKERLKKLQQELNFSALNFWNRLVVHSP